ncbi:hypothetical protein KFE25_009074 [Diacronema lutheri]|uniref:Major facilitator superfamily (MFS) profile domain-containing protein n=1 Tax=Diacronema lutheri TaxID=2081491 RepID=A0A8J5XS06_DIALT|nr:hypothetical protein KFE25_009074 [Diacronema lutheri]
MTRVFGLLALLAASAHGARPGLGLRRAARGAARGAAPVQLSAGAPRETVVAVSAGLLGAFQFGYALGVLNAPQDVICASLGISPVRWATVVSAFGPAGLVGAQLAGGLTRALGPKAVLLRAARLFLVGSTLQAFAAAAPAPAAFWVLLLGRAMSGVGAGLATVGVPVFLGECAPLSQRGAFGSLHQFGVVFGILAAQLLGLALSTARGWRYLFVAPAALALAQLVAAPLLLDSPARLAAAGRPADAKALLRRIRPAAAPRAEIDAELAALNAEAASAARSGSSASVLAAARVSPAVRRALLLGLLLMVSQQLSGVNAIFFYSTSIFHTAGLRSPAVGTLVTGVVNVLSTGAAVALVERAGRRPLLLCAICGMCVCALALTALLGAGAGAPASASLVVVCASIAFFEIGLGGIPWMIGNELFPPSCRPSGMALCAAVNWLATTLVALGFPLLQARLGPNCFLPFAACLALSFVLVRAGLPETKGRTVEQTQAALLRA